MNKYQLNSSKLVQIIKRGGVGVMPTDTLYGLVGLAMSQKAVAKIYQLKKRKPKKPCIILISRISDLKKFNIKLKKTDSELLSKVWPGKVSMVLPCPEKKFFYLHRGTKSLAFRLPRKKNLVKLLEKTGPLLAPSANWEGFPPAKNISQAEKYFGDKIDFYVSGGKMESKPSTLVQIKNGELKILRKGAAKL